MKRRAWARRLGSTALASACLLTAGCSFTTYNITRPLVVQRIPDAAPLHQLYLDLQPEVEWEHFESSMDAVRNPIRFADIRKYSQGSASRDLKALLDALEDYPENPYAWFGLGIHMALQHRTLDSRLASDRVAEVVEKVLEAKGGLSDPLRELYQLSLINQANYAFLDGDGVDSLRKLDRLDRLAEAGVAKLSVAEELSLLRIRIQALALLGRTEAAAADLARLLELSPSFSDRFKDFRWEANYPQIFDANKRDAVNLYLEGLIALHENRRPEAVKALEDSIRLDPGRWEAHFALASAFALDGGTERARRKLLDILKTIDPKEFYRKEVLLFNLAEICASGQQLNCAEDEYSQAIAALAEREEEVREELEEALRAACGSYDSDDPPAPERCETEAGRFLETARDPRFAVFSGAHVGLGDVLWQRALDADGEDRSPLLTRAHKHFRRALDNPRFRALAEAHLGLARVALLREDAETFLASMRRGLELDPAKVEAIGLLLQTVRDTPAIEAEYRVALDDGEPDLVAGGLSLLANLASSLDLPPTLLKSMEARLDDLASVPIVLRARADIAAATGEPERARRILLDVSSRHPDFVWPWLGLVRLEARDGRLGEPLAAEWIERGIDGTSRPSDEDLVPVADRRDLYLLRGEHLALIGDDCGALRDFERAVSIQPDFPPALRERDAALHRVVDEPCGSGRVPSS